MIEGSVVDRRSLQSLYKVKKNCVRNTENAAGQGIHLCFFTMSAESPMFYGGGKMWELGPIHKTIL